jgi:hypothetical protein
MAKRKGKRTDNTMAKRKGKRTDNTMAKRKDKRTDNKMAKGQTTIYLTLHRIIKIDQLEPL